MKICIDCKHYSGLMSKPRKWWQIFPEHMSHNPNVWNTCSHPDLVNPISGSPSQCQLLRSWTGECGRDGKMFEPKESQ